MQVQCPEKAVPQRMVQGVCGPPLLPWELHVQSTPRSWHPCGSQAEVESSLDLQFHKPCIFPGSLPRTLVKVLLPGKGLFWMSPLLK